MSCIELCAQVMIGIPASVLTLKWPSSEAPASLNNFETMARMHRFQALGKACREHGIEHLCLAHHKDDQAETVLMRLICGHRGLGLSGIGSVSAIPENHGVYGVDGSGALDKLSESGTEPVCRSARQRLRLAEVAFRTEPERSSKVADDSDMSPSEFKDNSLTNILADDNAVKLAIEKRRRALMDLNDAKHESSATKDTTVIGASATAAISGKQKDMKHSLAHRENTMVNETSGLQPWHDQLAKMHIQPPVLEHGGVQILRPFLDFTKADLVATCENYGVQWFEDTTNHDPTLTMRNAIRHLMHHHALPRALQTDRIVNLSKKLRQKAEVLTHLARKELSALDIKMDTWTGTLQVYPREQSFTVCDHSDLTKEVVQRREIESAYLKALVAWVSPRKDITIAQLATIRERMSPPVGAGTIPLFKQHSVFTACGVLVKRERSTIAGSSGQDTASGLRNYAWNISAQPAHASDYIKQRTVISSLTNKRGNKEQEPTWQLFDGRFWLKITNNLDYPIAIRLLLSHDIRVLEKKLNIKLKGIKQNSPRIPVIVQTLPTGDGPAIAIPSLGLTDPEVSDRLKYTVRYKQPSTLLMACLQAQNDRIALGEKTVVGAREEDLVSPSAISTSESRGQVVRKRKRLYEEKEQIAGLEARLNLIRKTKLTAGGGSET